MKWLLQMKIRVRRRRVRQQFSHEADDESMVDPTEHFHVSFFMTLMDNVIMSVNERSEQLKQFR